MNINVQPTIDALSAEITRLTAARDTLLSLNSPRPITVERIQAAKPGLSAKGRANIAAAQRKRWAEAKRKQRAKSKA